MTAEQTDPLTLDQYRFFYAEEIRVVAGLDSPDLVAAFARVPREHYLGPPPWKFSSGSSLRPTYRTTSNVSDLYHDIFVALKSETFLNNGQPGKIAHLIAALQLAPGKRVLHCGCGTGYYTAIIAEVVGPDGSILALEIDPALAQTAATHLAPYQQVTVLNQDAAALNAPPRDAIFVNAGVTHPHPSWLHSLSLGGVLVLPLSVGREPGMSDALVIAVTRHTEDTFAAELLSIMTIYSSPTMRDPARLALLNQSFESRAMLRLKSVRNQSHEQTDTCIVHTPTFCLSAARV